jgi:hypothetical protein
MLLSLIKQALSTWVWMSETLFPAGLEEKNHHEIYNYRKLSLPMTVLQENGRVS